MAKTGPETRLVARIKAAILGRYPGAFVEKIHGGPYQRVGLPDLLVIVRGRAIGLEVKAQRPGESVEHARNRATPTQLATLSAMELAGAPARVVLSPAEALTAIADALGD